MTMATGQERPTGTRGRTTTRRLLRGVLRGLRQKKGMSVEEVAAEVEWSASKLIRVEGGQVGLSVSDLNALLQVYDVHERTQVEELRSLARASRQRAWWSEYQRYIPAGYVEFIGAESDAARIRHFHPISVPGLLQRPAYADAIIRGTSLDEPAPEVARARAEIRRKRQERVFDRDDPPAVTMILDEAVLRRPIGDAETMRDELDHLINMAKQDKMTMVVVPFSAGAHPGLAGPFALFEYDDPEVEDLVCLETPHNDILVRDKPDLLDQYRRAADHLEEIGFTGDDAVRFVEQVREGLA